MPTLTGYTDNQIQVLVDFRCLETVLYRSQPLSVKSAKEVDYPTIKDGAEISNLKVKEGVFKEFIYALVKEYPGTSEDFESFLKGHLDSVYKAVCAVSAKDKIKKLLDEARGLAGYYDLTTFYQDNR
jgi:hypothetical protein